MTSKGLTPEQLIARGRYDDALVELHALRQTEAAGDRVDLAMGIALLRRGEIDRAELHLKRCLEAARRDADRQREAQASIALGEVYLLRGDVDAAAAALGTAQEQLREDADGELRARCLVGLAEVACALGDHAEGERLATEATEADATASAQVAAYLALAKCRRAFGDVQGADRAARTALAQAAELPRELAEAYVAYAHLIGDAGDAMLAIALDSPAGLLARAQALLR